MAAYRRTGRRDRRGSGGFAPARAPRLRAPVRPPPQGGLAVAGRSAPPPRATRRAPGTRPAQAGPAGPLMRWAGPQAGPERRASGAPQYPPEGRLRVKARIIASEPRPPGGVCAPLSAQLADRRPVDVLDGGILGAAPASIRVPAAASRSRCPQRRAGPRGSRRRPRTPRVGRAGSPPPRAGGTDAPDAPAGRGSCAVRRSASRATPWCLAPGGSHPRGPPPGRRPEA